MNDTVAVPVEELEKLEYVRQQLWETFGGEGASTIDKCRLTNLINQIWRVANTKEWS